MYCTSSPGDPARRSSPPSTTRTRCRRRSSRSESAPYQYRSPNWTCSFAFRVPSAGGGSRRASAPTGRRVRGRARRSIVNEREDDAVGRRLEVGAATPRERADARAARPAAKRHELGARLDGPGGDARGERDGHLVVSSTDVELLVGPGQREVAAGVEPEQIDDVERALAVDIRAVLADARVGDERAEPRAAAGERPLDRLLDRHPVERATSSGVSGVRRGISGRRTAARKIGKTSSQSAVAAASG